jgi:hypothetical protein
VFALVLPLVLILQAVAIVLAGAVIPLFEFTPVVVIVVSLASRRWRGVSHRLMRASFWLAVLMAAEWTAWVGWFALAFPTEAVFVRAISGFLTVYLVELLVLTTVFAVAVVRSFMRVGVALKSARIAVDGLDIAQEHGSPTAGRRQ